MEGLLRLATLSVTELLAVALTMVAALSVKYWLLSPTTSAASASPTRNRSKCTIVSAIPAADFDVAAYQKRTHDYITELHAVYGKSFFAKVPHSTSPVLFTSDPTVVKTVLKEKTLASDNPPQPLRLSVNREH